MVNFYGDTIYTSYGVWKKGVYTEWNVGTHYVGAMDVADGKVYVGGHEGTKGACLWIDGVRSIIDDPEVKGIIYSVCVYGEDV